MKRLNTLPERTFLKYFFLLFSCSFLIAAFFMPDRSQMLSGLWKIISSPTKAATNFFSVGGFAATFLNMGLVGLICTALYCIPGEKSNSAATLVNILTTGFGSWGIHILNIWPMIYGVMLYCIVRKRKMGDYTNAMLFSTGLAPFISELMVRYPNSEPTGFTLGSILLAVGVGVLVGFFLPAGLDNSPKIHKGFTLYSAALPIGMIAFLLQGILYKAMGVPIPEAISDNSVGSKEIANIFCCIVFSLCIIASKCMGGKLSTYFKMTIHPHHVMDFAAGFGNAAMLMNVGFQGFFILIYLNTIGAEFNGIVFGSIFCWLSTCNSGANPLNTLPVIWGYVFSAKIFSFLAPITGGEFTQFIHAQSLVVGICYATGLSPISSQYGWFYGVIVSAIHFCMVTTVPELHGGMCLYNGGFTAAMVCLLVIPMLEHHFRTKHDRRAHLREKFRQRKETV